MKEDEGERQLVNSEWSVIFHKGEIIEFYAKAIHIALSRVGVLRPNKTNRL